MRRTAASMARPGTGVLPDGNQVTVLIDFPDRGLAEGFAFDPLCPK